MKYPAILGGDFLYHDSGPCTAVTSTTTRAIAYWNAGGLTMVRYHMGMPAAGLTCAQDCYTGTNCAESTPGANTLDNAVTAGTAENTSLNSKLDYMAVQIGAMQAANVPVILALFHEAQPNGWFWWSKGTGAQYVALWKYAFDYLTTTKGLNNIIWLMPYSGLTGVSAPIAPYFPGKAMVDLSGPDYSDDSTAFDDVKTVVGSTMPIAASRVQRREPCGLVPRVAVRVVECLGGIRDDGGVYRQGRHDRLAHHHARFGARSQVDDSLEAVGSAWATLSPPSKRPCPSPQSSLS